jgi:adenylosuccinate synthase
MIVIGLGFGDEGKGLTTSYLCSTVENPLVVRFNGGHQAGHTVVKDGVRHVFSSFGAGSLYKVPSYLSHYCTLFPKAVINEFYELVEVKSVQPRLIVNPLCPVTTPYDLAHNQIIEDERGTLRHGSVGVGFGATIQRQEDYFKLFVKDLAFPNIIKAKLNNISKYYGISLHKEEIDTFLDDCKHVMEIIEVMDYKEMRDDSNKGWDVILEGAQGVLLDQDHGFFPNVTRSNTTTKNAIEVWQKLAIVPSCPPAIYYVTRTYQTRHGAGYMSNEDNINLINNEDETNVSHGYQGDFRIGSLDPEMLNYALTTDALNHHIPKNYYPFKKHLVVTCMDQFPISIATLKHHLHTEFESILVSHGPDRNDITLYKGEKELQL